MMRVASNQSLNNKYLWLVAHIHTHSLMLQILISKYLIRYSLFSQTPTGDAGKKSVQWCDMISKKLQSLYNTFQLLIKTFTHLHILLTLTREFSAVRNYICRYVVQM